MTSTNLLDKDRDFLLALSTFAAIVVGGAFSISGNGSVADLIWAVAIVVSIIPLTMSSARSLLKGDVGVDVIALLAMAGALALGEYLAGAVVALMMSGGGALESYADKRARRELTMLLERAPRTAHRYQDDALEQVDVDEVEVGDLVLVRTGEVIPIDGTIESSGAMLDESTLTGESMPVSRHRQETARSELGEAWEEREADLGTEPAAWTWGGIHRLLLRHPLSSRGELGSWFDKGPVPVPGDLATLNNSGFDATRDGRGWMASSGAGYRLEVDLGEEPPAAWTITGESQSALLGGPHYDDQRDDYVHGRVRRVPLDRSEIVAGAAHTTRLDPVGGAA